MVHIDFVVAHSTEDGDRGPLAIEPVVDGVNLSTLVANYESAAAMDPAGGYIGIVPANFHFGALEQYFLGEPESTYWRKVGSVAVLGCSCGEVGCWPFYARVEFDDERVRWHDFEQPHRQERDYSGLGAFEFVKSEYLAALQSASALLTE